MARVDAQRLVALIVPRLKRAEGLLRPRLAAFVGPMSERVAGSVCVVLSLILFLPIPLGNMPPALSISILSLDVLRRDGLWVLGGIVAALVSIAVAWEVASTLTVVLVELLHRLLA